MVHDITIIRPKMNGQSIKITIDGKRYESFNSLPYSESVIRKRIKETGCSLEEAIDYVMCRAEDRNQKRQEQFYNETLRRNENYEKQKFEYNGTTYSCFGHAIYCLNEVHGYHLNPGSVANDAKQKGITKQEAIDLALDRQMKRVQKNLKEAQQKLEHEITNIETKKDESKINDLEFGWKEITKLRLLASFKDSFFNDRDEFIAHKKSNTYFIFADCESEETVKCKVLEWLSRTATKGIPYNQDWRNERFQKSMLDGINTFLGTQFTKEDINIIYTYLGNACNHKKTLAFVQSGYDMELLRELSHKASEVESEEMETDIDR